MCGVVSFRLLAVTALGAAATALPTRAQSPNEATRILEKAQTSVLGEKASYTLRMIVNRTGKSPRVVTMDGFKSGDDRGLVRYTLEINRSAGTTFIFSTHDPA